VAHFFASQDLRNAAFRGFRDPHVPGAWSRLVAETRGWQGSSIIDHESFGTATPAQIDRAMADLAFCEVHVVVTARDLARQLPAVWQERIKNRSTQNYHEFLDSVRERRGAGAAQFWKNHGLLWLLRRWSRGMDPARVHVVTVPPPGGTPDLLWRRFAGLLGLSDGYDTAPGADRNLSLGAAEAAVLRRFNERIEDRAVPWPAYAAVFKQELAPTLGQRSARIEVPKDVFDWAVEHAEHTVRKIERAGYDVVGDLSDLVPSERPTGYDPDDVPPEAFAEAAVSGMVSLLDLVLESPLAADAVRRAQRGPVARRVEDLAHRFRLLTAARDAYRGHPGLRGLRGSRG